MAAKYLPLYYGTTKATNNNDPLIFCPSIVGVRSWKSKRTIRNKDSLITAANAVTKKQNGGDSFILVVLTKSIRSRENNRANTKNDNNKPDKIPLHICAIEYQCLRKSRKIIIKSNSDENERDKISDTTIENTKKKELRTSNSNIQVHILYSLILLNSSAIYSKKPKLTLSPVPAMLDAAKHNLQSPPYKTKSE